MEEQKITWSKYPPSEEEKKDQLTSGYVRAISEPWMVKEILGTEGTTLSGWCFRSIYQKEV